jgi:invasion protein IalB
MRILAILVTLMIASAASAQERPTVEQGKPKKKQPESAAPLVAAPDRTTETFGDWSVVCAASGGADERLCEVDTSIVLRGQSAPFARIAVLRPAKDQALQLIAVVPADIATASPAKISTGAGQNELTLPFRSCVPSGCVAGTEVSKEQLQALGKTQGQLTLVDAAGKSASVQFSLRGFDRALEAYFRRQEK